MRRLGRLVLQDERVNTLKHDPQGPVAHSARLVVWLGVCEAVVALRGDTVRRHDWREPVAALVKPRVAGGNLYDGIEFTGHVTMPKWWAKGASDSIPPAS
eukprot:SAG31_NODE_16041_length_726_cov_0.813397_1_plen_99_part_01